MIKNLPFLIWPNPLLKKKSEAVDEAEIFGESFQTLIADMIVIMHHHGGVGLSAIQIGVEKRVFVMEVGGETSVWVNPKILFRSPETEMMSEGCLSLPGVHENVRRHTWVHVRAADEKGLPVERRLSGLAGHCFQHELDHLNGKMFPDRMDPGARDRMRAYVRKNSGANL